MKPASEKARSSRLDPLPATHTPELESEFNSFLTSLGFVPNSVLTMQRKPKLVKAFVALQAAIWDPDSKVDRGLKRLIAHAASRAAHDEYSMAHTASGALHFGIDEDKLRAAAAYATSPLFTNAEKAALDVAVAAAAVPNATTPDMFARLRQHWGEEEIVEIVAVIAVAGFLARWNTTMLTPLEPEPIATGEMYLKASGWTGEGHR